MSRVKPHHLVIVIQLGVAVTVRRASSPRSPTSTTRPSCAGDVRKRPELAEDLLRRLHADPAPRPGRRIMHSLIYFSFLVLAASPPPSRSTTSCRRTPSSSTATSTRPTRSSATPPACVFLIGVLWAIVRRYVVGPYRIRIKSKPEHAVILGQFLVIGVTGFVTEACRIAIEGRRRVREVVASSATRCRRWSTGSTSPAGTRPGGSSTWSVHRVPRDPAGDDVAPHVHVAAEHVPAGPRPAQGRHEADAEPHGDRARELRRVHVEDFTWKQLLDTDACTMCGRCTSVCPAHATGKPLDPARSC